MKAHQFFGIALGCLLGNVAAALLSGCGAAPDSTSLLQSADRSLAGSIEIDRGFEEIPADLNLPPIWEGSPEMFPDIALEQHQYHGGYAVEGLGLRQGGLKYLQDGGETTWAVKVGSEPTRPQLDAARAAFAELSELLPTWTFVELPAPNGQTDIVIDFRDNANVPDGCSGAGQCWFGSAGCRALAPISPGVDGFAVCEQFAIDAAVNNIETFIAAYDAHPQLTWEAFFLHEIGHTLGLNHASKSSQSIMRPSLWVPGAATAEIHSYSCRELERLRGYLPMPGAWAPLEIQPKNPETCQ